MSKKPVALFLFSLVLAAAVASAHTRKNSGAKRTITAEEKDAYLEAKPVFEKHCFRCHTKTGSKVKAKTLGHLSMDGYPFGGHHADDAGAAFRRTLGIGANVKSPTMPKDDPGAVKGDELAKILAWTEAFDRARAQEGRAEGR